MKTLEFIIDNDKLIKNGDFSKISKGELKCHFKFKGQNWSNCKAAVVFENGVKYYTSPLSKDGICIVPEEITDASFFRIYVVSKKLDLITVTNHVLVIKEV